MWCCTYVGDDREEYQIQLVDRSIDRGFRLTLKWKWPNIKDKRWNDISRASFFRREPNVFDNEITSLDSRVIMWETRRNDARRGRTFFLIRFRPQEGRGFTRICLFHFLFLLSDAEIWAKKKKKRESWFLLQRGSIERIDFLLSAPH